MVSHSESVEKSIVYVSALIETSLPEYERSMV